MVKNRVKMLVKWWFKGGSCPPPFCCCCIASDSSDSFGCVVLACHRITLYGTRDWGGRLYNRAVETTWHMCTIVVS